MLVRTEYDDAIATITLDSPANRNALSKQLVRSGWVWVWLPTG